MPRKSRRFANCAMISQLFLVLGEAHSIHAQPTLDYAKMNKAIDADIAKRRADLPQQMAPDLYVTGLERLDKAIVYTLKFTTVDLQPTAAMKQEVTTDMTKRACADPNQRKMMEWGYTYSWLYLDAKNSYVARVYVDLSQC